MIFEEEYVEYVMQISLTLIAISATYFFNPETLLTTLTLLTIPLLYGFTAYTSRNGFSSASLLSLITLIFAPLGAKVAIFAVLIPVGNVFVSFFASGEKFTDYYSSTMIPLVLMGIFVGGTIFTMTQVQPKNAETLRTNVGGYVGDETFNFLNQSGIIGAQIDQKEQQTRLLSKTSILLGWQHAYNKSGNILEPDEAIALNQSIREASNKVPEQIINQSMNQVNKQEVAETASNEVESQVESLLSGDRLAVAIPIFAVLFYSIQPLMGLFTAISSALFEFIDKKMSPE